MTTTRTVSTVTVSVARDSMGDIDLGEFLSRLDQAIRELPDVTEDTEVNVFAADVTRHEGLYSDSQPWQYDAMTDRLHALAEDLWAQMCRGD
jgi:hypothetical protein